MYLSSPITTERRLQCVTVSTMKALFPVFCETERARGPCRYIDKTGEVLSERKVIRGVPQPTIWFSGCRLGSKITHRISLKELQSLIYYRFARHLLPSSHRSSTIMSDPAEAPSDQSLVSGSNQYQNRTLQICSLDKGDQPTTSPVPTSFPPKEVKRWCYQ